MCTKVPQSLPNDKIHSVAVFDATNSEPYMGVATVAFLLEYQLTGV